MPQWWTFPEQRYIFQKFRDQPIATVSGDITTYVDKMCSVKTDARAARDVEATAMVYFKAVKRLTGEFHLPERGATKLCDLAPQSVAEARELARPYIDDDTPDETLQRALDEVVLKLPPLMWSRYVSDAVGGAHGCRV